MNGSSENSIKHNILIPNEVKEITQEGLEILKCDDIPLCNYCLFELEIGPFICNYCKVNLCDFHLRTHNKKFNVNNGHTQFHKIFKLQKN